MRDVVLVVHPGEEPFDVFLTAADTLLAADQFPAAVVSAQTACEVITETAIGFWLWELQLPSRGRQRLKNVLQVLRDSFRTFTLTNERLGRLYVALSDDPIKEHPFWQRYVEHERRRHRVVHKGYVTTRDEAEQSLAVAREFVERMKGTLPLAPYEPPGSWWEDEEASGLGGEPNA